MSKVISFLVSLFSNKVAQEVTTVLLQQAAARSNNTVDDQVVAIVSSALAGQINPIQRVVGK